MKQPHSSASLAYESSGHFPLSAPRFNGDSIHQKSGPSAELKTIYTASSSFRRDHLNSAAELMRTSWWKKKRETPPLSPSLHGESQDREDRDGEALNKDTMPSLPRLPLAGGAGNLQTVLRADFVDQPPPLIHNKTSSSLRENKILSGVKLKGNDTSVRLLRMGSFLKLRTRPPPVTAPHARLVVYQAGPCGSLCHTMDAEINEVLKSKVLLEAVTRISLLRKKCYDGGWEPDRDFVHCAAHRVTRFPSVRLYVSRGGGRTESGERHTYLFPTPPSAHVLISFIRATLLDAPSQRFFHYEPSIRAAASFENLSVEFRNGTGIPTIPYEVDDGLPFFLLPHNKSRDAVVRGSGKEDYETGASTSMQSVREHDHGAAVLRKELPSFPAHFDSGRSTSGKFILKHDRGTALVKKELPPLPPSFDWRHMAGGAWEERRVMNQGNCGSCYAVATTYVLQSRFRIGLWKLYGNTTSYPINLSVEMRCRVVSITRPVRVDSPI